jgi:hypothetical protein
VLGYVYGVVVVCTESRQTQLDIPVSATLTA